jgi:protein-serine/threonine kinase
MLAGYLPFDDDPANPEGDNINLLYKYIVSTPLTFPEYVTPHARDLLKRILVPDPRKRADLFEVARHSWLSEYAHVVAFITSSTTTPSDITNTTVPSGKSIRATAILTGGQANVNLEDSYETPHLARSASVREPTKAHNPVSQQLGGLQKQERIDNEKTKTTRDAKRRTVQVEYVAPARETTRGEQSKTRARTEAQGPVEVPLPEGYPTASQSQEQTSAALSSMPPPSRPARGQVRATSEHVPAASLPPLSNPRPSTQGSMSGARMPSRGNSYGQPAVAVAKDTAQGRFSQPRGKQYTMASPLGGDIQDYDSQMSDAYSSDPKRSQSKNRGHKRSSTLGELFGKRFGSKEKDKPETPKEKTPRSHPPVSM